jgi:DUF4097 and DUF4098 domain-containing protein YvlB
MKLNYLIIAILMMAAMAPPLYAAPPASSRVAGADSQNEDGERVERTMAAESNVLVTVCIASGDVIVNGWDRAEVHASTIDAEQLELRRETPTGNAPASRVEVLVANGPRTGRGLVGDCLASSDIMLDVPRGATVQIKTRDGAVEVMDVADARVESLSGDIALRRISKRVEAATVSGDVSLESSSGPVRLRSISGSVEASNARIVDATDDCQANTVSGDVTLSQIAHSHVEAWTISGIVSMKGPLARGGSYEFKTTSGDLMFSLPSDASFRVSARIRRGEILTDFPLKDAGGTNHSAPDAQLLTGTHGTGDATLTLYTYSGTVHLRRQPK